MAKGNGCCLPELALSLGFGTWPETKQSNPLLILITEMILICREARADTRSFSWGGPWVGGFLESLPLLLSSSLLLLKATFPEGPFHLRVFNYVKWIPSEEDEKAEQERKRERERGLRERETVCRDLERVRREGAVAVPSSVSVHA